MKIASVKANNRRRAFEVTCAKGEFVFPYEKAGPRPGRDDPIVELFIDPELANEGFSYVLASGADGCVLLDWVFDYNEEPGYMRDLLVHNLTVQALERLDDDLRLALPALGGETGEKLIHRLRQTDLDLVPLPPSP